jgi:hypothetical protein
MVVPDDDDRAAKMTQEMADEAEHLLVSDVRVVEGEVEADVVPDGAYRES